MKKHDKYHQTKRHHIDEEKISVYIQYKAFDLISDGSYKKNVVKSKENGDRWAIDAYNHVQDVAYIIKSVVHEINSLHEYGKNRLQRVCLEVISCVNPPCRRRMGWNVCSITGTRSDECIDLTKSGKSESVTTIHPKFSHFLVMLWVVAKFEHICKVFTRSWLSQRGTSYQETRSIQEICQDFSKKKAELHSLFKSFDYAHRHVVKSIQVHKNKSEFEISLSSKKTKTINDSNSC